MADLVHYFSQNKFCVLIEYLTSIPNKFAVKTMLTDFPALMTLADRVHSDQDMSPLDASFFIQQELIKYCTLQVKIEIYRIFTNF